MTGLVRGRAILTDISTWIYVLIEREEMVLLHAYKKQGRKLPPREREVAMKRMKELLS